jgi:hypothetical protein
MTFRIQLLRTRREVMRVWLRGLRTEAFAVTSTTRYSILRVGHPPPSGQDESHLLEPDRGPPLAKLCQHPEFDRIRQQQRIGRARARHYQPTKRLGGFPRELARHMSLRACKL